jgi:hypothetical protein
MVAPRKPRHAFDQEVPLREQTDEYPLEHGVLPGDDPADLEERLLELLFRLRWCGTGKARVLLGHMEPFLSRSGRTYESMRN